MTSQEIAKEITLKAMDNNLIKAANTGSAEVTNKSFANETCKFYKKIFKTLQKTKNNYAE